MKQTLQPGHYTNFTIFCLLKTPSEPRKPAVLPHALLRDSCCASTAAWPRLQSPPLDLELFLAIFFPSGELGGRYVREQKNMLPTVKKHHKTQELSPEASDRKEIHSLNSPNRLCLMHLVTASGKGSSKDLHSSCQGKLLRLALLPPCPTSRFPMDLQEV